MKGVACSRYTVRGSLESPPGADGSALYKASPV